MPLWQVVQLELMPAWLIGVLGPKAVVLKWQVEQSSVDGMWVDGIPTAVEPLWQVAQPEVTPA